MNSLRVALVAIACATTTPANASPSFQSHPNCKDSFYEAIDSGEVNSVNGLAIERDFSRYFYTSRLNGRANIFESSCVNGRFLPGKPTFVNHPYEDYQPVIGIDGNRFCFTSSRPIVGNSAVRQNVWCGTLSSNLSDVHALEALISPHWDGHAVEIEQDIILFASERSRDERMVEIFQFNLETPDKAPVPVTTLNSPHSDNDMAYETRTGLLVFSRYNQVTGDIDLFASLRNTTGWGSVNKLENLSDSDWNMSPTFTPDGKYLLFKNGNEPFKRVLVSAVLREL